MFTLKGKEDRRFLARFSQNDGSTETSVMGLF